MKTINPKIFIVFAITLSILCIPVMNSTYLKDEILVRIFGGVEFDEVSGALDILSIGRWLLFLAPLLLSTGIFSDRELITMSTYVIPRFSSYKKWWRKKMTGLLCLILSYVLTAIFIETVLSFLFGKFILDQTKTFLLLLLCIIHFYFICSIMMAVFSLTRNQALSIIVVLGLEGATLVTGMLHQDLSRFMPGTWGMYLRSSLTNDVLGYDIILVIIIQLVMIFMVINILPKWFKKNGTASIRSL